MERSRISEITQYGMGVWLDAISRRLIESGELARLIGEDGVTGVTSNPTIFMKAILGGEGYDDDMRVMSGQRKTLREIYYDLTRADVVAAADILTSVYDETGGRDGFVSVEVLPEFAYNTEETCREAEWLYGHTARHNVMVKVPGNPEGIPCIRELIARGHLVNATVLFSAAQYEPIAHAHVEALQRRHFEGLGVRGIPSVASVYLSRTDDRVDAMIDRMLEYETNDRRRKDLMGLRGQTATATAKVIYKKFKEIFSTPEWRKLEAAGAIIQKPLWASLSTKDPQFKDVKYVESVIGADTIATIPEETLYAFKDHGTAMPSLEEGLDEAPRTLQRIKDLGIDLDRLYDEMQHDVIISFESSHLMLMEALDAERHRFVGARTSAGDLIS